MFRVHFFVLLAVSLILAGQRAEGKKRFFYSNVKSEAHPAYGVSKIVPACDVNTKEKPCGKVPTAHFESLAEMNAPKLYVRISEMPMNRTIIENTYDTCNLEKLQTLSVVIKYYHEQLKHLTNWVFGCPVPKKDYFINAFEMSPRLDLLTNLFPHDKPIHVHLKLKNDFGKGMEIVYVHDFDFEIIELP